MTSPGRRVRGARLYRLPTRPRLAPASETAPCRSRAVDPRHGQSDERQIARQQTSRRNRQSRCIRRPWSRTRRVVVTGTSTVSDERTCAKACSSCGSESDLVCSVTAMSGASSGVSPSVSLPRNTPPTPRRHEPRRGVRSTPKGAISMTGPLAHPASPARSSRRQTARPRSAPLRGARSSGGA